MNIFVLAAGLLLLSGTARAQPHGQVHSPTMTHPTPHPAQPSEPGQSAFAAIQEIVAILEADPATDWAKVDIEALRQHLIDMNAVTLNAEVVAEPIDGGARFQVGGTDRVRGSIRRMVMAHAATMNGVGGWMFKAEETSAGAVLTVTVSNPAEVAKVRALGFIGVLTHGMHHQAHHQMIASGRNPHG
jgi:hypothetical protein